jgi:hypothetical protein
MARIEEKKVYVSEAIAKETIDQLQKRLNNPTIRKQERRLVKRRIARIHAEEAQL